MGETGLPQRPYPLRQVMLAWLMVSALLLATGLGRILGGRFPDPDDILRLVQVRDLLAGQGWFDLVQHRIDPASAPVMHWSRLVDLPLVILIGGMTPLLGQAMAEQLAVVLVPVLALLATMLCIGRVASRLFERETIMLACLAIGFMPILVYQFQPLRIDHHGWQICAAAAALAAISGHRAWRGGALAGLAMAAGMSISLELLPVAAVFGAVLALRWLRDRGQRMWLVGFLQVLALGLFGLFAATRGFGNATLYCDAITVPHLILFAVVAAGATALAYAPPAPWPAIAAGLGLSAALGLAVFGYASPECVRTPFGALDPVVRDFWYNNVLEGRPLWHQDIAAWAILAQVLAAFVVALALARRATGNARAWWTDYLLLYIGFLLLGLLVWRAMAFASVLAVLPLGWLLRQGLQRIRTSELAAARIATIAGLAVVLAPMAPVQAARSLVASSAPGPTQAVQLDASSCDVDRSVQQLAALPKGTIFAPLDIGPAILQRTGHSVIATAHHRAEKAMKDVILAFTGTAEDAHALIAKHKADYVVLCADLVEPDIYIERGVGGSFAAGLRDGSAPSWLEPVKLDTPAGFRVWRVVK
ncbi:hypothetical protein LY632_02080 [Erythrobacter sp. SDW2]|uniref:hypothetical protein n=1 Tax=Erythrobacter sp. SDW2 TaxID=2907154 RepID=UPI001F200B74|nr:hypothetical protein [Erythrobacter sp. SDW2]UIP07212.1 hypothetical protein LY632_02080 [Erythrobacter sp. SDW2]